jgi:GAF domain-containing protein
VASERLLRILARLGAGAASAPAPARLCEACAEIMTMTGAGIMLMSGEVARGSVCSSDEVSAFIEDLQYTLGEGPCVDAYHDDRPVVEPDLAGPARSRWLAFTPRAVEAGARAVFGFPLRVGAFPIGALNLYRDHPGPLDDDQHANGLVLAGVAARAVLAMQAEARPGTLAAELEAGADFRFVVHQASGMVSAQLHVGVGEALIRLRAYAFANDRPLAEVAGDVVARQLRFA